MPLIPFRPAMQIAGFLGAGMFRYNSDIMKLFKSVPLTFRERRELILIIWSRNGYQNRHRPGDTLKSVSCKISSLMMAI